MRAISAAYSAPRQIAGSTSCRNVPQPAAGKIGIRNTNSNNRQTRDHEARQRDAERRQRHQRQVGQRAAIGGRDDARGEPKRQRERQRQNSQRRRDRQPLRDDLVDVEIVQPHALARGRRCTTFPSSIQYCSYSGRSSR